MGAMEKELFIDFWDKCLSDNDRMFSFEVKKRRTPSEGNDNIYEIMLDTASNLLIGNVNKRFNFH